MPIGYLTFAFLDSGQGDCTLVWYPDGSLTMIDCGSVKNKDLVANEIQSAMNLYLTKGQHVKNLIVTHPDQDHYNMLPIILGQANSPIVDLIYYGGDLALYKNKNDNDATFNWLSNHKNCNNLGNGYFNPKPDQNLSRAGVDVYILAANATGFPKARAGYFTNANSIVLMFECGGVRTFLMGDATRRTEDFILANVNKKLLKRDKGTLLKMGHHGSDTSSSEDFISTIKPQYLFVSSDTRPFGATGKGLPTKTRLGNVETWSGGLAKLDNALKHSFVYWDDQGDKKFNISKPKTTDAMCTTLYELNYEANGINFSSTGGSWYATIDPKGKIPVQISATF